MRRSFVSFAFDVDPRRAPKDRRGLCTTTTAAADNTRHRLILIRVRNLATQLTRYRKVVFLEWVSVKGRLNGLYQMLTQIS